MIVLAILGLIAPLLLGYGLSLFFNGFDFKEKMILSANLGIGILTYIIFFINQLLSIRFDFATSIVIMIVMLLVATFCVVLKRKWFVKMRIFQRSAT